MSGEIEVSRRINVALGGSILSVQQEDLRRVVQLVAQMGQETIGCFDADVRDRLIGRAKTLLMTRFPFSKLSVELGREALTVLVEEPDIQAHQVLRRMVVGRTATEIKELLDKFSNEVVAKALNENYEPDLFYLLLRLTLNENYKSRGDGLDIEIRRCLAGIDYNNHPNSTRLVEIILQKRFLEKVDGGLFFNFVIDTLCKVPFDKWPNKESVIVNLFENIDPGFGINAARFLFFAHCDSKTSEVGGYIFNALSSSSLRDKYVHLHPLRALLPSMRETHFETIFKTPFQQFEAVDKKRHLD